MIAIICEQFVYGLFNGYGYVTKKTLGVNQLLSKESFQQLKALRLQRDEQTRTIQMRFRSEDLLTVTFLKRTNDNYGRQGLINHTFIMKHVDYLNRFPPKNLVSCFTQDYKSPPNLKPLTI